MKWAWVLIAVLLVPMSVQAESTSIGALVDGAYNPFGKGKGQVPNALKFAIVSKTDVLNLRASIWLYMRADTSGEHIPQGRCVMFINRLDIPDMRDPLIYEGNGPEIWLSHVKQNEIVAIDVFWDDHDPSLRHATIGIESSAGHAQAEWKGTNVTVKTLWKDITMGEDGKVLQRFSLEDVCRTYTSAELMKGY